MTTVEIFYYLSPVEFFDYSINQKETIMRVEALGAYRMTGIAKTSGNAFAPVADDPDHTKGDDE